MDPFENTEVSSRLTKFSQ